MDPFAPPNELSDGVAHLWVARGRLAHASSGKTCRGLLSPEERRRESRLPYQRDRILYRLSRALMRTALSLYAAVDPEDWVFTRNPLGRPLIETPSGTALDFSLAHTFGLVVLLVSSSSTVGIDVEEEKRATVPGLSPLIFGGRELLDLKSRRGSDRKRRILEYWTLKEAYGKARGIGLSLPLHRWAFELKPGRDRSDPTGPGRGNWWFSLPSTVTGYVTAVAIEKREPEEPPPRLETIVLDRVPTA